MNPPQAQAERLLPAARGGPGPNRAGRGRTPDLRRLWTGFAVLAALVAGGCSTLPPPTGPAPGRTHFTAPLTTLPARLVGNHLVVELPFDRTGAAHFLVDTGSSVTLVSPEFAARVGARLGRTAPQVHVRTASGATTVLPSLTLRRLNLGNVRFERVPALLFDTSELSAHLGVRIDGILGFPFFADTTLTLDYPNEQVALSPVETPALVPGSALTFDPENGIPLVSVHWQDRTLQVLIDSGSDGPLNLNPTGLDLTFASGPRPGASVSTLAGERKQAMARLAGEVRIGEHRLRQPIVDLTDQLSSLGGEILKHFTLTFDQRHGRVTLHRESTAPLAMPPVRGVGLGFSRTPAYWRVTSVIPDSPADRAGILPGDLVTRINGQPVENWDLIRYDSLMRTAPWVEYTFLNGREETTGRIAVAELVP